MRAAALIVTLLLLTACARNGEPEPMTPERPSEPVTAAPAEAPAAAPASEEVRTRELRTATFALG